MKVDSLDRTLILFKSALIISVLSISPLYLTTKNFNYDQSRLIQKGEHAVRPYD
jgi:hypothetical protein